MKEQSWGKIIVGTILGILGLFAPQIILGFLVLPLLQYNQNLGILVFVPLVNIAVISIVYAIIRYFLKDNPSVYGLKKVSFNWKWIVFVTALPLVVTTVITILLGGKLSTPGTNFPLADTFFGLIMYVGFLGSVTEEFVFHGLVYPLFRQKISVWWSALVTGIIFALVHLPNNDGWTVYSFSLFFFGALSIAILFAYITESSDSIWNAAWGHVVWNILMSIINISPKWYDTTLINVIIPKDVPLISGGDGGITISIVTPVICLLASTVIAWRLKK